MHINTPSLLEIFCKHIVDSGNKTFEEKRLLFNEIL